MIRDLPQTTTAAVAKLLVRLRDEGGAVALGRVLTLVIDVGDGDVEGPVAAANDASREHPCRVIVLARAAQGAGPMVDAEVRLGGDAGASEVVVVRAPAKMLVDADTLIMPLLLPDAPIVVWWPHHIPEDPSQDPVGRMAQRRITDSVTCSDPLAALGRLREVHAKGNTDMAWTRLTVWRGLAAASLDQPPHLPVKRTVVTGDADHPSVDLLAAWFAEGLRCPVEIERVPGAIGITRVTLERSDGDLVIDRPDGRTATITQPGRPARRAAMPMRELDECLAEELRRLDDDEVYGETLVKGMPRVGAA